MPVNAHDGPAAVAPGVDTLALLAAGFFPTHAPRPTGGAPGAAFQAAIRRACTDTASDQPAALLAQTPLKRDWAAIRAPSHSAAGLPAIAETFRVALPRLGVRNTIRVFTTVNQKTGFDCQSCAWPSPDGKRHTFEFCENGTKLSPARGHDTACDAEFFHASIREPADQSGLLAGSRAGSPSGW